RSGEKMWRTILAMGFLDPSLATFASLIMPLLRSDCSHNSHSLIRYDRTHPLVLDDVQHHHSLVITALSIQAIFLCRSIKPVRKSLAPCRETYRDSFPDLHAMTE